MHVGTVYPANRLDSAIEEVQLKGTMQTIQTPYHLTTRRVARIARSTTVMPFNHSRDVDRFRVGLLR
jgi:hypothetical protein